MNNFTQFIGLGLGLMKKKKKKYKNKKILQVRINKSIVWYSYETNFDLQFSLHNVHIMWLMEKCKI